MNKKNTVQNIKFILVAVVLGLTLNYVSATTNVWTGPSASAPGNNREVVLNDTVSNQEKGADGVPDLPALLDVKGTLSATNLVVWNDGSVTEDFYINSLGGINRVCVDSTHKLYTCAVSGPICGNTLIESGEQCDDGNTANGDGCSSTCQSEGGGTPEVIAINVIGPVNSNDPLDHDLLCEATLSGPARVGGETVTLTIEGGGTAWDTGEPFGNPLITASNCTTHIPAGQLTFSEAQPAPYPGELGSWGVNSFCVESASAPVNPSLPLNTGNPFNPCP